MREGGKDAAFVDLDLEVEFCEEEKVRKGTALFEEIVKY